MQVTCVATNCWAIRPECLVIMLYVVQNTTVYMSRETVSNSLSAKGPLVKAGLGFASTPSLR